MKTMLKIVLFAAVMALPGMAAATILTGVSGTADCDGFTVTAEIHWGSAVTADFSYTAVLVDEGGVEVASVSGGAVLNNGQTPYVTGGSWGLELCGTYTATVTAHMEAVSATNGNRDISNGSFTATFICDCPTDACNFTPGFWKNHAEDWPVMELSLGGVSYTQAQLLVILDTPVRHDATIILAYHLIAAKLNVLNGSDTGINGAIGEADDLLAMYPLGSNPGNPGREMIISVKSRLAGYNELGCPGDDLTDDTMDKALPDQVDSTWGDLKATYR